MVGFLLKMNCCCTESLLNKLMILSSAHLPRTILETSSNSQASIVCKRNSPAFVYQRCHSSTLHKCYYLDLAKKFNTYGLFRRRRVSNLCSQYASDWKAKLQLQEFPVEGETIFLPEKLSTSSSFLHSYDPLLLPIKEVSDCLDHIEVLQNESRNKKGDPSDLQAYPIVTSSKEPFQIPPEFSSPLYIRPYLQTNSIYQETPPKASSSRQNYCYFSSTDTGNPDPHGNADPISANKPSAEQLSQISDYLVRDASKFFSSSFKTHYYTPDVVFENRIRGFTSVGIIQYRLFLRAFVSYAHLRYSHLELNILKISQHPDESVIKVRWQIRGTAFLRALLKMKLNTYNIILDGFSTFHIDKNGKIYRHIADNMMPDEEKNVIKKLPFMSRLAVLLGLAPKTAEAAFSSLQTRTKPCSRTNVASFLMGDCEKS